MVFEQVERPGQYPGHVGRGSPRGLRRAVSGGLKDDY
jgi:hypothetical protein